ncbi:hypothetical protein DdX_14223 [Ditylenchus destructor]|uniref:Uncharacterized protein n=1 Tax=Ditylenchus destructor TaxID=166010 RepID=A0AAD4MUZ4_9BILA|nr:hypothetical protein DdX_14223 [Ditylenchus destructor]
MDPMKNSTNNTKVTVLLAKATAHVFQSLFLQPATHSNNASCHPENSFTPTTQGLRYPLMCVGMHHTSRDEQIIEAMDPQGFHLHGLQLSWIPTARFQTEANRHKQSEELSGDRSGGKEKSRRKS